jgi:hypothetical protein
MRPAQFFILGVLLFSVYLAWSLSRGRTSGVPLYAVSVAVMVALLSAAVVQLVGTSELIEPLNVVAMALSLAALPAGPSLWEEQMAHDLSATRLYRPMQPTDVLSWRAWLKLVDRCGARGASLVYLGVFAVAILAALFAPRVGPSDEQAAFALITVSSPTLFAFLSTIWIYRSARRIVPGA